MIKHMQCPQNSQLLINGSRFRFCERGKTLELDLVCDFSFLLSRTLRKQSKPPPLKASVGALALSNEPSAGPVAPGREGSAMAALVGRA